MRKVKREIRHILISRTDRIGDVVLTLPVAGMLKQMLPGCRITFLGRSYTRAVAACCIHIDHFCDWDEMSLLGPEQQVSFLQSFQADAILHVFPFEPVSRLARLARIPIRIGTAGRWYHWRDCSHRVLYSRKRSDQHEAQLNMVLLQPLGLNRIPGQEEIAGYYGFVPKPPAGSVPVPLPSTDRFNLILHPFSRGSAREWGMENYCRLIRMLPEEEFRIYVTGTEEERDKVRSLTEEHPQVHDLTGKLTLPELITFIAHADGLVACSTGPLHLAAAAGIAAIGIYPPIRPMHPGRWAPIGPRASYMVAEKKCNQCRNMRHCECIHSITPEQVYDQLIKRIHH